MAEMKFYHDSMADKVRESLNRPHDFDIDILTSFDDDEWHNIRSRGIGGSDAGGLLGISKYKTPYSVYKSKTISEEERKRLDVKNVFMRKGTDLEGLIREKFVAPDLLKEDRLVTNIEHTITNVRYPYFRANVDGFSLPVDKDNPNAKGIVVEIKWVSEWAEQNWNQDDYLGIPPEYYAQVQLYMAVTKTDTAYVYALMDSSWEIKKYIIPRDENMIDELNILAKEMMTHHVAYKLPPKISVTSDTEAAYEAAKAVSTAVPKVHSDTMLEDVISYREINEQIKELTKTKDELKDKLFQGHLDNLCINHPLYSFSVSTIDSLRLDNDLLKSKYPEVYNECCATSTQVRINVRKKKIK